VWSPPSTGKPRRRLVPLALVVVLVLVVSTDALASRSWSSQRKLDRSGFARRDAQPPSAPSGLGLTRVTATTLSLSWRPSRDNRGLRGYVISRDATLVATTRTSTTLRGLACGRTYTLGVAAVDTSGNSSRVASLSASTSPCPDRLAPTRPANVIQTAATDTTISLLWSRSLDDVGVAGYGMYLNRVPIGSARGTSFVATGLKCGTSYSLGIDSYDSARNRSAVTSVFASTSACPVTVAVPTPTPLASQAPTPTTSIPLQRYNFRETSHSSNSISTAWDAQPAAVKYRTGRNGLALSDVRGLNYTFTGLNCGTAYSLSLQPFDLAGPRRFSIISATTAPCSTPPTATAPAPLTSGAVTPTPPPTLPPSPPAPPPLATPTTPSPPPPTVGAGEVVFNGDFETGNVSQWTWGAQCANTGVPSSASLSRGTVAVQSEIVAQGNYAARIDLPAAPSDKTACETLSKRATGVGTDDYYGLMVRFPSGWREPSHAGWGLAIAQLNYQGIWGAPVMLVAHADRVALVLQSGLCRSVNTSESGCAYTSGPGGNVKPMLAVPPPLALGAWHQLVVHLRWATDSSGVIEVWHRTKGASNWKKTVSVSGYPTVQWTAEKGPQASTAGFSSDKIGAYRGRADFPLTVWHDGFVRTSSFGAAVSALP
jgi:chitodextrinase